METVVLIAQQKNMSILVMKRNANSAVFHHMVMAVLIVRLKNTGMGMVKINAFGAVQRQMAMVARIALQKNMKNKPSTSSLVPDPQSPSLRKHLFQRYAKTGKNGNRNGVRAFVDIGKNLAVMEIMYFQGVVFRVYNPVFPNPRVLV